MKYLLDVNALIACIWTDHANHAAAEAWVQGKALATCPLSELGFLRVSTNPRALGATMPEARRLLKDFLIKHRMEFVPADLPGLQSNSAKSDEVTDIYLAELASKKMMRLATLDSQISHGAVELIT